MPRRPGNHLSALPTQVPYTAPVPMPPIAAPRYNSVSESAIELIDQAKATWMAALPQRYLSSIGLTNSVQPYCRFATAAMQMMPSTSWIHGLPNSEALSECESVIIAAPPRVDARPMYRAWQEPCDLLRDPRCGTRPARSRVPWHPRALFCSGDSVRRVQRPPTICDISSACHRGHARPHALIALQKRTDGASTDPVHHAGDLKLDRWNLV